MLVFRVVIILKNHARRQSRESQNGDWKTRDLMEILQELSATTGTSTHNKNSTACPEREIREKNRILKATFGPTEQKQKGRRQKICVYIYIFKVYTVYIYIIYIYIYLERMERVLFCRVQPPNRGQTGSRYVYIMYIYIHSFQCWAALGLGVSNCSSKNILEMI